MRFWRGLRQYVLGIAVPRVQLLALTLGLAITAAGVSLRVADPYELRLTRELVFDEFQRLAPRPYRPVPVRIVDIDEISLARIGQWPWPRSDLARLTTRLRELGASAIVFDMIFPEPDRLSPSNLVLQEDLRRAVGPQLADTIAPRLPDNDELFRSAIASAPAVLGFGVAPGKDERRPAVKAGLAFTGADPSTALPAFEASISNLPRLEDAARGVGAITLSPRDEQGVVRRVPLFWSDGKRVFPGLAVETLRVAQHEATILIHSRDTAPYAMAAFRLGSLQAPVTQAGELRVWFAPDLPIRYVSAARLLSGDGDPSLRALISGHIVLIGTSATGLFDGRVTPLGEIVPGVSVHAQVVEQILTSDYLKRPDWVDPLECIEVLLLGIVIMLVTVSCAPITALAYGGLLAAITFIGAWSAFRYGGLLLDPVFPSAVGFLLYFILISFRYLVTDRERRFVRQAFARYVAPSYLAQIESDPTSLRLGGEEREVTVLFLDIRNFTALSERLSPTEVVNFLNVMFGRLSADILAEGGTIDKYIGDSIMAFWNAPIRQFDHRARACRAALRIRNSLKDLNDVDAFRFKQRADPLPPIAIGIGINTGSALVGNMGSESRFNYSVVGDVVNVASRIEGQAKRISFDIVVSQSVVEASPKFAYLDAGMLDLRGRVDRERLFILIGDEHVSDGQEFQHMRRCHEQLLASIRQGSAGWDEQLAACHRYAEHEFPVLMQFFEHVPERTQDFQDAITRESNAGKLLAGLGVSNKESTRSSR